MRAMNAAMRHNVFLGETVPTIKNAGNSSHSNANRNLREAALLALVVTFITICIWEFPGVTVTDVAFV